MGLASATTTALNGMRLNETSIDVLGNNVANAGTRGFKSSEALFTTQLVRTLSSGDGPRGENGGTNPRQIGLGATVSTIRRDFSQGSVTTSNSPTDMAIEGEGFFIVQDGRGTRYTRDGSFTINPEGLLVNAGGARVQGYPVDGNFNLQTTAPADVVIPLGKLYIAEATSNVEFTGAVYSAGDPGTRGTRFLSGPLFDAATGLAATGTTALADLRDAAVGGNVVFTAGDAEFAAEKGGRKVGPNAIPVATSDLDALMAMIDATLGIQSGGAVPDDGPTNDQPGVTVTTDGEIQIVGNQGVDHDFAINPGLLRSGGVAVQAGFQREETADGESAVNDFVVYDSLGQEVRMRVTLALESVDNTASTFRWQVESPDDSGADLALNTGLIRFDGTGNLISGGIGDVTVAREDSAAISPLTFEMDFRRLSGISSENQGSNFVLETQNGSPPGTLVDFGVGESGSVTGVFDNGLLRQLGQVVFAQFANVDGLVEAGGGTFQEGPNSGKARLVDPASFGAGLLRAGAIELSNTDIGKNLVDLIIASTNYRGNARIISSTQELTDELLLLGR